jgi:hypothetical protein
VTLVEFETRLCFCCKAPLPHGREHDSLCDDCYDVADSSELAEVLEEQEHGGEG